MQKKDKHEYVSMPCDDDVVSIAGWRIFGRNNVESPYDVMSEGSRLHIYIKNIDRAAAFEVTLSYIKTQAHQYRPSQNHVRSRNLQRSLAPFLIGYDNFG
jgi:hypothetical protein